MRIAGVGDYYDSDGAYVYEAELSWPPSQTSVPVTSLPASCPVGSYLDPDASQCVSYGSSSSSSGGSGINLSNTFAQLFGTTASTLTPAQAQAAAVQRITGQTPVMTTPGVSGSALGISTWMLLLGGGVILVAAMGGRR